MTIEANVVDEAHSEGEDNLMKVSELIEKLKTFPGDMPVVILAKMPYDKDEPENRGKTIEELDEEHTIEVALDGLEQIDYEEENGHTEPSVLGFYCDLHSVMEDDDEDAEDDETVDNGD